MLVLLYLVTYIDKANIGTNSPIRACMNLCPILLMGYFQPTGNAEIEGLLPSLHMNGHQYNIALSIFFVPFVLAGKDFYLLDFHKKIAAGARACLHVLTLNKLEVPSNMILNRIRRPSIYIGVLIVIWGIVMTCTGFVQNFAGLVVIRFRKVQS